MAQPYDHKETKGSLWPNDKAKEEPDKQHPSMKGSFKWQGELLEIAAWTNNSKNGTRYLGLEVGYPQQPEQQQPQPQPQQQQQPDDLPF